MSELNALGIGAAGKNSGCCDPLFMALASAESFPEPVGSMILRGVFTASKREIDHFYRGGIAAHFPENFELLVRQIDHPDRKNYPAQLLVKIQNQDSAVSHKAVEAWPRYEIELACRNRPDPELEQILTQWPFFALSLIANHYMAQRCFLVEGQLLAPADKLRAIPALIINGRYDIIGPPITAFQWLQKWPRSKSWVIEAAGHSASRPGIAAALVRAAKELE